MLVYQILQSKKLYPLSSLKKTTVLCKWGHFAQATPILKVLLFSWAEIMVTIGSSSKRCYVFLQVKRLQSCGPLNFEDDPIFWNSNPGLHSCGSTPAITKCNYEYYTRIEISFLRHGNIKLFKLSRGLVSVGATGSYDFSRSKTVYPKMHPIFFEICF